ncbi:hypothetical protein, partial [Deinococcus sp. S9]|uniref:hypothetical protein n=1 Tax=Deinococcus sp. S9 TaxID=2545754 RepID=UPI0010564CB5
MRRTFLHPDCDTFNPDHLEAVLTLAKAGDGTCLSDVMSRTGLGRTAAMSLLAQLAADGTLYSVHDKARRHLRYHFDGFDLNPAGGCVREAIPLAKSGGEWETSETCRSGRRSGATLPPGID